MEAYRDRAWLNILDRQCQRFQLHRPRRLSEKLLHRRILHRRDKCESIVRANKKIYVRLQDIANQDSQCLRLAGVKSHKPKLQQLPVEEDGKIQQLLDLLREDDDERQALQSTQDTTPVYTPLYTPVRKRSHCDCCCCVLRRRPPDVSSFLPRSPSSGSTEEGPESSIAQQPRVSFMSCDWSKRPLSDEEECAVLDYRYGNVVTAGNSATILWRPPRSAPCASDSSLEGALWVRIHRRIERLREQCSDAWRREEEEDFVDWEISARSR